MCVCQLCVTCVYHVQKHIDIVVYVYHWNMTTISSTILVRYVYQISLEYIYEISLEPSSTISWHCTIMTRKTSLATTKKHQNSGQLAKTSWFSSHIWLLALGFKINICVLMICPILLAESKVLLVQSLCLAVEPHFPFQFFRVKPVNPFTPNCLMAMFDYQRINPQFWWSPRKILA